MRFIRISFPAMFGGLLVLAGVAATGCATRPTPPVDLSAPPVSPAVGACTEAEPQPTDGSEWFEGTCYGWRVGAEHVLSGESYENHLQLDCEPELFGDSIETSGPPAAGHPTSLDLALGRIPRGMTVTSHDKWACGKVGLSDHVVLAVDGEESESAIDVTRWLEGTAWLVVDALPGTVAGCSVLGRPAVCIDYPVGAEQPSTFAFVFVLEDAVLDPSGVVLRISSDDVSLDTLKQVAASIVGA